MSGLLWPDVIIGIILIISTFKGFRRGFVSELGGAVAVVAALVAPWYYNGAFDPWIADTIHVGSGSAHVIGMFLTGFITYAIVIALSWVLNRFAKLPLLNIGNSIAGAIIGALKGCVLVWLVLFIALYFPLSPDIRTDLHESRFAAYFTGPDANIDRAILATIPWFARPFLNPYFHRHHV